MFLVGHALVAFLIAYCIFFMMYNGNTITVGGINRKNAEKTKIIATKTKISFALVMLLGILPDFDMVFQAAGIMPHKTFTHSPILSGMVVAPVILVMARWPLKQTLAASLAYALAFAQHIFDDIVVGSLNVAYPFGSLSVGIGIAYGSVYHLVLEISLVAVVAAILMSSAFGKASQRRGERGQRQQFLLLSPSKPTPKRSDVSPYFKSSFLFSRFGKLDKVCYALLLLSFLISFGYLFYEMKATPHLFVESGLEMSLFVLLHLAAVALVSFMIIISRGETKDKNVIQNKV
jgi:hypothetical protein